MKSLKSMSIHLPTFQKTATAIRPDVLPCVVVPGLYVHIPFCFHKCHYCDFYSITRQTPERMSKFVDLILQEADLWTTSDTPTIAPRTIFFGGGTPSLLPFVQIKRLIEGLQKRFDFSGVKEWTIEINPATADYDYCCMLRSLGVDRLSFGAQSFDLVELKTLERHHDPEDVVRSIELARQAGFVRLNVDLIYAIPGQSLQSWDHSLSAALKLQTPHVSAYGLTYEDNTPMTVRKRLGQFKPATDSLELDMLHHARNKLKSLGYHPYEISNHAIPTEECQHNLLYWTGGNYVGIGPSAASHVEGYRFKNRPHLGEWETAATTGYLPVVDFEKLTIHQRISERIMLQLRLETGVTYADFTGYGSIDIRQLYATTIKQLIDLDLIADNGDRFYLTDTGLNVADAVAGQFVDVS